MGKSGSCKPVFCTLHLPLRTATPPVILPLPPPPPPRIPPLEERRSQFEVDFVCLSYCNSEADLYDCRALLDTVGMTQTKVGGGRQEKAAPAACRLQQAALLPAMLRSPLSLSPPDQTKPQLQFPTLPSAACHLPPPSTAHPPTRPPAGDCQGGAQGRGAQL